MSHICCVHLAACDPTAGLDTLREAAATHKITVRLYYRVPAIPNIRGTSWRDVLVIAEGADGESIDAFIAALKSAASISAACQLYRRWAYSLPELPEERKSWGYDEWMAEAEREMEEWRALQQDGGASSSSSAPAIDAAIDVCDASDDADAAPRLLGPPGVKGAAFTDWKELVAKRLEKLNLDIGWDDVVLAAELNASAWSRRQRVAAEDDEPRKKRRPADSSNHSSTNAVDERIATLSVGSGTAPSL